MNWLFTVIGGMKTDANAERPIDFYLCAPYLMRCHSYKPQIVFHKTVQRIHVSGLRQRTQLFVINCRHVRLLLA